MTPNQVNLLVAMAKALEDLLAGARDTRQAVAFFRGKVEREAEQQKAEVAAIAARRDCLLPPHDWAEIPQAELNADPNIYRTPGWTHEP